MRKQRTRLTLEQRKALTEKLCLDCKLILPIENFRIVRKEDWCISSYCKKCLNKKKENKLKGTEKQKEKWKRHSKKRKQWLKPANKEKMRLRHLEKKYGMSEQDYKNMLLQQGGVCKLCGGLETRVDKITGVVIQLAIDHCHETNKVRGLLCGKCNRALGGFQDRVDLLQKAIEYLKETNSDKTP